MDVWRIAAKPYADLDGEGARRYGSRWTPRGDAVTFASATLSLAALERFVHSDPDLEPESLVSIRITVPAAVKRRVITVATLPSEWRTYPAPPALAALGEQWLRGGETAVLEVPSVIIPHESNFVMNPAHPDFAKLAADAAKPFSVDPRLWKTRG